VHLWCAGGVDAWDLIRSSLVMGKNLTTSCILNKNYIFIYNILKEYLITGIAWLSSVSAGKA
jgi:uncharacterized membrane protein